jgi:hypothetical protein
MLQQRFEDSDEMYKRSLAVVQHTHGLYHEDIPARYDNLGELYFRRGREYWKEAEDLFRSSLSVQEKVHEKWRKNRLAGGVQTADELEKSLLLPRSVDADADGASDGDGQEVDRETAYRQGTLHRTHNNIAFIAAMQQRAREDDREVLAKAARRGSKKGVGKKRRMKVVPGDGRR